MIGCTYRIYTLFIEQRNSIESFLGAAAGSPYIVFISTSSMLRSSDRYIYIYIIHDPTRNRNNEFIIYITQKKMADFERGQLEIGLEFVR